jgi:hypothetical protein
MTAAARLSPAIASVLGMIVAVSLVVSGQQQDGKDTRPSKDSKDSKEKASKDKDSDKRPKVTLKAQPLISIGPSKVTLRAELVGGANDYEEYYCPTVEWDWGDGTQSESTNDCEPYEAGKSEIKRRFTVEHLFRAGYYQVAFRLKRKDKALVAATATVQVQAGGSELGR